MNKEKNGFHELLGEIIKLHFIKCHSSFKKLGIYPGQAAVLFQLNKKDGQSQREIGELLNNKPATTTVMIQRMERANLITKKQDEVDKRITRVYITEKGKDICRKSIILKSQIEEEELKGISEEERIIIQKILMKVKNNIMEACKDIENVSCMEMFHNKFEELD